MHRKINITSASDATSKVVRGTPGPVVDERDRALGARIRKLRLSRSATLAEVAAATGISIGQLSEIERGLSAPSLRSLRLISEALHMPVGSFFEGTNDEGTNNQKFVRRHAERPVLKLTSTGVTKTLVSPPGDADFDVYEISIAPGGTSGGELQTGPGWKAGLVSHGRVRLWLDGQPVEISAGDSFQFPADMPHSLENPFDGYAVIIWIAHVFRGSSNNATGEPAK